MGFHALQANRLNTGIFQPIVLKFARVIHDENKSSAQRLPEKTQNPVLYVVSGFCFWQT